MKTSENEVKYSSFNMGEMDKFRELYSKEGDNSSRFEGKTVLWEHTVDNELGVAGWNDNINKRPKGPHIVHLSTMCHLFEESDKADIFV